MTLAGTTVVPASRGPAVAAASHKGRVRVGNEDAVLARPESGMLAVADGMGGLDAGAEAARSVIEALAALAEIAPPEGFDAAVGGALAAVNASLYRRSRALGYRGMGSTVVVMRLQGATFTCLWAGDSRAYRWRAGRLERLTADHTPLQSLIDAGVVGQDGDRHSMPANLVIRAVGVQATLVLDAVHGTVEPGDRFLLCSDGLTKVVSEEVIAAMLGDGDVALLPHRLVEATLAAGAPDNVSVIVAEAPLIVPAGGGVPGDPARMPVPPIVSALRPGAQPAGPAVARRPSGRAVSTRVLAAGLCAVLALQVLGRWGPNLDLGAPRPAVVWFAAGLLAAAVAHGGRWTAAAGWFVAVTACGVAAAGEAGLGILFDGAWRALQQHGLR